MDVNCDPDPDHEEARPYGKGAVYATPEVEKYIEKYQREGKDITI